MASNAYTAHLQILLRDAEELDHAHRKLKTGKRGRQWKLGALNRAVVVICVSSWEAYIEQVIIECLELLKPAAPPLGSWPALNASARSDIGRFNNPTAENTRKLFTETLGVADVTADWYWRNCEPQKACEFLNEALHKRHQVAHGVNPRPIVDNSYSAWLPKLFRNLGRCTDRTLRTHLANVLGVHVPW
jgi:HEPN superfamily RiboL-PSP-like protein